MKMSFFSSSRAAQVWKGRVCVRSDDLLQARRMIRLGVFWSVAGMVIVMFLSDAACARARVFFDKTVAQRSCSPWDGPAVWVKLAHGGQEYPLWAIHFYRFPVSTGMWLDFSDTSSGYITYCKEENACSPVAGAKVILDKMTDGEISGELKAEMDGVVQSFPFSSEILRSEGHCG